ncbi:MAG: isopeptide-forming domain-containing fimbrial protein [Acidobacteriota bacterium]|jgi:uncharacterized repeat protein (TIGR01451 family)
MRGICGLTIATFIAFLGGAAAGLGAESAPVDLTKVLPYTPPASVPVGGPVPYGGQGPLAILDDFNRPDGPIGGNWTVRDGFCNVSNNAAVCGSLGRATFNGAPGNGDTAEMDVANNGTALQYAALLLNYGAGSSNLFLKVQNQSGGTQFGHAACYTGNNGASFGLGFFALSSPFSTAHMRATRSGSDVTIQFTNIDGGAQPDQTYVCSGAPAPEGTGIGIGGYAGVARMDNFAVGGAGGPAISLVKTVGTAAGVCAPTSAISVAPGTTVYYCYTVTNTGTVTLPLHDLSDDQLGTIFSGLNYVLTPGSSINTVAAGLSISALINSTTTNTATWSAYDGQQTATAQATATVTVTQPANVSGTKTVSGAPYRPGGSITYTIVLTNAGPGAQGDNPGDEFVDALPPQLTATGVTASSGTAALAGNLVTWNGAIAAGGSVTITITATINASVPGGTTVSNQGTINYDGTGTGSNGSSRLTDDPGVPGNENPTTFVVTLPDPIPTLGVAGLAGLVLLLGFAGLLLLRRLG